MPRLPSTLLVVGLLLLAGCTGGPPAGSDQAATTTPPPDTTTDADSTTTITESQVVDFAALNADQQAAFRDALDGSVSFVPDSPHIDDSEGYSHEQVGPFETYDYVRYDGELYRITLAYGAGTLYASYEIRASAGSPSDEDTVTNFTDIPADLRDEVRTALTEGRYYAPMGKWGSLPHPLADTDYIRYENETYRMGYTVGDWWAHVLTVEKAK